MQVIKIIKNDTFTNSKGKKQRKSYYALEDNGKIVPIKPIFNVGYTILDFLCSKKVFEKDTKAVAPVQDVPSPEEVGLEPKKGK